MKQNEKLMNVSLTALMAAVIAVMTYIHLPVGTAGGYIHLGDAFIYLASAILPTPYAVMAGVIGAGLVDYLSAPLWIIPTLIIKTILVFPFTSKKEKILCTRNMIAAAIGVIITVGGYFLAEGIMYGNWYAAFISNITMGAVQGIGSAIVFIIIASSLDKSGIKIKNVREKK